MPKEKSMEIAAEDRAAFIKRTTEEQVAWYKSVLEEDYSRLYLTEDLIPYYPYGAEAARALNDFVLRKVKEFKDHAAASIKEYEEKGVLAGFPPAGLLPQ